MKKLIFDVQVLQTPALRRGMGQYVISLITAMAEQTDAEIVLLYSSLVDNEFTADAKIRLKKFRTVNLPLLSLKNSKDTNKTMIKNKKVLNSWIKQEGLDGSNFIIGSIFQADVYSAFPDEVVKSAIVYDVIPLQLFHQYAPKMRWVDYLDRFSVLHEADLLFCISKTTASDLQIYANVQSEKIVLVNGGPGELAKPEKPTKIPEKKFILMPTGNDIRKNNLLAAEAFGQFNQAHNNQFELVITSTFTSEERDRLNSVSSNLFFTSVISDAELAWYFSNCESLFFPSLYEGLGMPIIEAMVFDKPIAASNIEVFIEISDQVAFYFNPYNVSEMVRSIELATINGQTKTQKSEAEMVSKLFTWQNSAKFLLEGLNGKEASGVENKVKSKIAVLGPHVTGSSAIGKFISEIHPELAKIYEIDYYYEKSPVDKVLRPDILGHIAHCEPIHKLTDRRLKSYDAVIYHVGNSNHHSLTVARALTHKSVVILHDLNVENVYNDLYKRKLIGKDRLEAESRLDNLNPSKSSYLQSIVNRQNAVITHSKYARKIVEQIAPENDIYHAPLAVGTPMYSLRKPNSIFTIGLAGILAGIKGLELIERIAQREEFKNDKIRLFGLNFVEPGLLDKLRQLPNVEIATDLSDFEFQQNLKSLDVLVNFRVRYQGEASYATLEAMRYGIPAIVRGDFGWYSELPSNTVVKVENEKEVADALIELKKDRKRIDKIAQEARKLTAENFSARKYVKVIEDAINGADS